jgi:hypothetical protein
VRFFALLLFFCGNLAHAQSLDQPAPGSELERLVLAVTAPASVAIKAIQDDCKFRAANKRDQTAHCIRETRSFLEQMQRIWISKPHDISREATIFCMDNSQTLNGFDWRKVSACYEQTIIAARRQASD